MCDRDLAEIPPSRRARTVEESAIMTTDPRDQRWTPGPLPGVGLVGGSLSLVPIGITRTLACLWINYVRKIF